MNSFLSRDILCFIGICAFLQILTPCPHAETQFPKAIKIVAPNGFSTSVYTKPSTASEVLGIAFNGTVMETVGAQGEFIEVRVPDKQANGFVLKEHTTIWEPPQKKGISLLFVGLAGFAVLVAAGILLYFLKARKAEELAKVAASIPASIKRGEELYRMSDYEGAIKEFNSYLNLQGGEVRNPDVYRRLTVCYQNVNDIKNAAHAWEKMRSLGGLRTMEDYTLGVELMIALGRETQAAEIYEHLLEKETDEERRFDIHKKLFETYRRLKDSQKIVHHAVQLKDFGTAETSIIPDTVNFLFSEGKTDVAIESNNKDIIMGICEEFVEEKAKTAEAARIYLKCLEYVPTDQRLHRLLADIYNKCGDYRRAVSELIILNQLDKEQPDKYIEEAAKIYIENGRVADALAEGNPLIIKKIAQSFLVRSEVNAEAVAVYEKVLEFQPRAVGINRMLSTVYLTRGQLDKYTEKLRLLHELDGKNHDYLSDLAQCIIDNDLIEETIREGNRELNTKVLRQLMKRGATHDKAVELFEKLINVEPNNVLIRSALVKAYEQRGEPLKQFAHLLALANLKPEDEETCEHVAKIAVENNLLDRIIAEGNPKLFAATGLAIVQAKMEGPEAKQILEIAAKQDPEESQAKEYLQSLNIEEQSAATPLSEPAQAPPVAKTPVAPKPVLESAATPAPAPLPLPEVSAAKKPSGAGTSQNGAKPDAQTGAEPDGKQHASELPQSKSQPEIPKEKIVPKNPKKVVRKNEPKPQEKPREEPEPKVRSEQPAKSSTAAGPPQEKSPPLPQTLSLTDSAVPFSEKSITTFVSGFAHGQGLRDLPREELFLPGTGGMAYKEMEILLSDGWGNLHVGAEVNTAKSVLMRIFRKDLLDVSAMEEFVVQATDLGYNLVHESVLPLEEAARGRGGAVAFVHPFCPYTLEGVIRSKRRPDLNRRLALIGKLLEGLSYAHNYKGIDGKLRRTYHFHLQPGQILVDDTMEHIWIACLGYSQMYRNLTRAKHARWQEPGMNPATMPPEFFRSRTGTIRERSADIYSLGVLMYFIATGEFPFEGPSFDDYKFQHSKIFAAPPRLIEPTVPDWLEPIILGCLEKEPEKRWDTVIEMKRVFTQSYK
ncbi:MAG TPA: protein kinase [Desulfomonilaceae bacterium]|nr:protein kinase [Desulfomonilaceae bacterium]